MFAIAALAASVSVFQPAQPENVWYEYQLEVVSVDGQRTFCSENRFEDDWLIANWSRGLGFAFESKRAELIEILWDEARFSLEDAPPERVTHEGERWGDHFERQHATNLLPFATTCDLVIPVSTVRFDDVMSQWQLDDLLPPAAPAYMDDLLCGTTFEVTLPLRAGTITRRYRFRFGLGTLSRTPADPTLPQRQMSWIDPPDDLRDDIVLPERDSNCEVDAERDRKLGQRLLGASGLPYVARLALSQPRRRDYLAICDVTFIPPRLAIYRAPHGKTAPRIIYESDDTDCQHVEAVDINHDGIDELKTSWSGNRSDAETFWWWDGRELRSMMPDGVDAVPFAELRDLDGDGLDEMLTLNADRGFDVYRLRGDSYEPWRSLDVLTKITPDTSPFFDATHIERPRMMTIRNLTFDDWPAPASEITLNGRVVATAAMLARNAEVRVPVTVEEHNVVCLNEGDDQYPLFQIVIEPVTSATRAPAPRPSPE